MFTLQRTAETETSTAGHILGPDGVEICKTLERGARSPDHPRIPAGSYEISRKPDGASEFDRSFRALLGSDYKGILWLPNVPGRTNIEIHTANYVEQLLGCIASGLDLSRDPESGEYCVPGGMSSPAYKKLYLVVSTAIDAAGGARLSILDIPAVQEIV